MAWTYTGNPASSDKDKYRFLISDTDENDPILQDEEIQYVVDTYESENKRLYELFQRAADKFSKEVKRSLGPQSEDPTGKQEYFRERASFYKRLTTSSGISTPTYAAPKSFAKGIHDNV